MSPVVLLLFGAGGLCCVFGMLRRRTHARATGLAALLSLPGAPLIQPGRLGSATVGRVIEVLRSTARSGDERSVARDRLRVLLDHPTEVASVLLVAVGAIIVLTALSGSLVVALAVVLVAPTAVGLAARRRVRARRAKVAEQFPEALQLIASSLEAGNPIRRCLQILAERGAEPLSSEMNVVIAETELGAPLVDAFDRMADRLQIDDIRWFARALRIQERVGGQLAPLVRTVAEVMAARAELQREARVLTAEGRTSAWVLGALPVFLGLACHVMNPGYLAPMFQGWGVVVLAACAASVVSGIAWILRMVEVATR